MAYYVTTDGVNQTIDAPGFLFPSTGIIRIAVDRELLTGGGGIQITTPSSGSIIFYAPASNYFQISFTGTSQFMFGAAGYSFVRGEQAIELDFGLGVIRCYGGASSALLGTFTATSVLSSLGGTTSTSLTWGKRLSDYSQSDVYAFQILENAVLVKDYDPSLSNGTGLVVPESLGGTSASLINYNPPNDDSQWVFYGASGTTAAITEVSQPFTDAITGTVIGSISAAITELSQPFTDSIVADLAGNLAAAITESSQPFTDSITGTVFGNLSAAITETAGVFSSAISATLTPFSGAISGSITETAGLFTDSILATVIGSISGSIIETSAAFTDSITANIAIEINSSIIELNFSFTDSLVASIPATWVNVNPSANNWTDGNTPTNPWTNLT
jgi:hypothetical protein